MTLPEIVAPLFISIVTETSSPLTVTGEIPPSRGSFEPYPLDSGPVDTK